MEIKVDKLSFSLDVWPNSGSNAKIWCYIHC